MVKIPLPLFCHACHYVFRLSAPVFIGVLALGKRPKADPVTRAVFCKYSISKRHTFDVTISYNQISISYIFRFPRKYFSLFYLHVSEIILIFAPFHADTCTTLQADGWDDIQ